METEALKSDQQAYVLRVLKALGDISLTALARMADVRPSTLTRFMNNPQHHSHLSATTIRKIETASGIKAPHMDFPSSGRVSSPLTLTVRGIVAAGVWREVVATEEGNGLGEVPVAPLSEYANRKQYALLVEGHSVNRRLKPGDYAICVEYEDMPGGYKDGDFLHVERHRAGLVEATIKRVRLTHDGVELWPDSDHPNHQEPIELGHTDEDTQVIVKGVVIGSFSQWR